MERRSEEPLSSAARLLFGAVRVLLAAIAAFVIASALQSANASAAAPPDDADNPSLFGLVETVAAPVVDAAAPVVEVVQPVVAVAAPVGGVAAPVVEPVVAAAAPVVEVVESVAAPLVAVAQPVVAVAQPVVDVVQPVAAAVAPVAAAAPVVDVVQPLPANVRGAVESAVAHVSIVADRLVGAVRLLDALDTVDGALDLVVDLVPGVPPVSKVVGDLPTGLDPVNPKPVGSDTIDVVDPPTRSSQPDVSTTVPDVVTLGPPTASTPDRAIGIQPARWRRAPAPSDPWNASGADPPTVVGTLEMDVDVARVSVEVDLRLRARAAGDPLVAHAPAIPRGGVPVPAARSSGSGGDPFAAHHAVVPTSAHGVNWLSRGVTTDVSWASALFVLSIECPG